MLPRRLVAAVDGLNPGIELLMALLTKGDDGDMLPQLAAMLSQHVDVAISRLKKPSWPLAGLREGPVQLTRPWWTHRGV